MITLKDQNTLLKHVGAIESTIFDITDEECRKLFNVPKDEVIQNQINALKHFIADLANYKSYEDKMKNLSDKIKIKDYGDIERMNPKAIEILLEKYGDILIEELTLNQYRLLCRNVIC